MMRYELSTLDSDNQSQTTCVGRSSASTGMSTNIMNSSAAEQVLSPPALGHHTIMANLILTCEVLEPDLLLDARFSWVKKYYTLSQQQRFFFGIVLLLTGIKKH
jgi:hypothetical protein